MDGRIGQLDCRITIAGDPAPAGGLAGRLRRVAQRRLAQAYGAALDTALGDAPTVFVLRDVHCDLALAVGAHTGDTELADRWGRHLAGAVARAIVRGADVVTFADQADFVAHFVADLLRGAAWDCWHYGAFARLRSHPLPAALRAALLEDPALLPKVLGSLHQLGALERLLAALTPEMLQDLRARVTPVGPGPDEIRPLFAAALALVDGLGLWARARPGEDALLAYVAAGPPAADWRDARSLAVALQGALRFLLAQGYLRRPLDSGDPQWLAQLDRSLAALDWLDTAWLRRALLELLVSPSAGELPPRPAAGPTPRQRDLAADLLAAIAEHGAALDRRRPDDPANALRLRAWLVARDAAWAAEPQVEGFVERLLRSWRSIARAGSPATVLQRLRQHDIAGALRGLPEHERGAAAESVRLVGELGAPALMLLEALLGAAPSPAVGHGSPPALAAMPAPAVDTGCAGVALLLRAVLDARLQGLLERAAYPTPDPAPAARMAAMLLALGLRWGGAPSITAGQIDPGLRLLAGWDGSAADLDALRARWVSGGASHDQFQIALLRTLIGQRLARGPALHLYGVTLPEDTRALVAGDGSAALWPLGRVLGERDDPQAIATAWATAWAALTGQPIALVGDASPGVLGGGEDHLAPPESAELDAIHAGGRERLTAALAALDAGRLGSADADLAIGLAAASLLRLWSRWLGKFADSSLPYLLHNFIRRPGRVVVQPDGLLVELAPLPLDIILSMSGYTADLEGVPWLDGRKVRFAIRS